MENSYGIGITNRYDLFYVDDDAGDPADSIRTKKAKKQKSTVTGTSEKGPLLPAASGAQSQTIGKGVAEKENKPAALNKNSPQLEGGKFSSGVKPSNKTKPIKDTQIIQGTRDDRPKDKNVIERPKQNGTTSESREQRNNRRNRDDNRPPYNPPNDYGRGSGFIGGGNSGGGTGDVSGDRPQRRGNRDSNFPSGQGGRRPYGGGGGKREFDRQSGSDKTGVKAIDKREGGGAHNWGTHKQDIEDLNKTVSDGDADKDDGNVDGGATQQPKEEPTDGTTTETIQPVEEEAKEITLDEWKAQRAVRAKPQFNIRKAGEGEDTSQWKKMIALNNRKNKTDMTSDEELEYDPSMYPQRVGRQKHVLDIEFHFNDARRSGGGMGRGGRGMGRQRGGRGGTVGGGPGQNRRIVEGDRRPPPLDGPVSGGGERRVPADVDERPERIPATERPERRERRRFDNERSGYGNFGGQNAPKMDDESAFPSLG